MDRAEFLRRTGTGAAGLALAALAPRRRGAPAQTTQWNILLVITDDQPFYTVENMGYLKELVSSQGASFERAYCGDPLCDPSRCCTFLGLHLHNHRMWSNDAPGGGMRVFKDRGWEEKTYLKRLKDAGYEVGYFGKSLHHEWGHAMKGVDRACVFVGSPHHAEYFDIYDSVEGRKKRISRKNWDDTDFIREKAEGWIKDRAGTGRPFVCVFAPFAPHGPYGDAFVPDRVEGKYKGVGRPPGPYDDNPEHYEATAEGRDGSKNRQEYQDKRKEVKVVDDAVRVLSYAVEGIGATDRTYIFFTTDQPYMLGEHKLTRKGKFYDHSSRVPMIVKGPDVPRGVTSRAIVSNIDLHATFLDIAGVAEVAADTDGRSLLPALTPDGSTPTGWRERLLVEHKAGVGFRMLREDRYCYVEFEGGGRLAYDMDADPWQTRDIYGELTAEERDRLEAALATSVACSGASCRKADGGL